MKSAIAIGAHPDDIEFYMAGTLLLLKRAGWEIHYLNIASGNCGSVKWNSAKTRGVRRREAREAAKLLGAQWHPPLCDDLEIVYEVALLRRLAAIVRAVKPAVVLTHSPQDYMEDHTNTCRLAVTAAFSRGMPNFVVDPPTPITDQPVTVYHAQPHGNRDGLWQPVRPGIFVDIGRQMETKAKMLAAHASQKEWLDESQGLDSYIASMRELCRDVGRLSGRFEYAEG